MNINDVIRKCFEEGRGNNLHISRQHDRHRLASTSSSCFCSASCFVSGVTEHNDKEYQMIPPSPSYVVVANDHLNICLKITRLPMPQ